jgi:long-subunit acyl-CoA synthetase (AMP-forming)
MTSFGAMTDATKGITKSVKVTHKDRYLSYLPVAHGMERWLGEVRWPREWCLFFLCVLNPLTVLWSVYTDQW